MNEFRRRTMVGKGGGEVEYVDLGLPSGLLWATCNVGANSPTEAGLYFSWGNVVGHSEGEGYNFNKANYDSTPGSDLTADIPINATYDAAKANLGGLWRMPTYDELNELKSGCTWNWKASNNSDYNGVVGYEIVGSNGNKMFMPCYGHYNGTTLDGSGILGTYWSTKYNTSSYAYLFDIRSTSRSINSNARTWGSSVRGVCNIYYPGRQGAFVYDTRGKFYTADEWSAGIADGSLDNDDVVGVAVISGEHRFVIAPQAQETWLPICPSRNYGIETLTPITDTDLAKQDFDGEANTDALIQQFGDSTSLIEGYAKSYTFKNGKSGYVPALGELVTAYNYKGQINACRSAIGLGDIYSNYVSSSTYYGYNNKGYFDIWGARWTDGYCGHQHYDRGGQIAHYIFCSLD